MSAIDQLEMVKKLQTVWSDNAVSVTVYYKKEELEDIKKWLKENLANNVKSVSFLLYSGHGFKQAPYQEIDKDLYFKLKSAINPISFVKDDGNGSIDSQECASGACPIK